MISLLLPTRKRFHGLQRILDTTIANVSNINNIEFLLKFDDDDVDTITKFVTVRLKYLVARYFISPRDRGYRDLVKFTNFLCTQANPKSNWFFVINDDCYCNHKNWDLEILKQDTTKPLILNTEPLGLFPIINRCAYERMGHFSVHNHMDTYLGDVATRAGCRLLVPLNFIHEAHNFMDEVRAESRIGYGEGYLSPENQKAIEEDAQKLCLP